MKALLTFLYVKRLKVKNETKPFSNELTNEGIINLNL